jgi:type II secretory pathway predicted ATPase ExeA
MGASTYHGFETFRPSTRSRLLSYRAFGDSMYTGYFGFREKPFGVTPDPRFFYTNPCYQEAYASLLYGIRERRGFVVLTGEIGTGKTTLLRRLMEHGEPNVRFVFVYNTTLTFEELLNFIGDELGLPTQEAGRLRKIQALNQFLMDELARGRTVVLLIDEAQNLGEEVLENLRLLSNLETASEKLLQIVLVGQPELESKLNRPELRQLKQRIAIQCRLERLDEEEVGPFINYRLGAVGYKGHQLFTPDAVEEIAYYSRGFPRLINILCDNALLIAYATSRKRVTGDIIAEVAGDLRFELRRGEPLTAVESQQLPSDVGSTERPDTFPLWRAFDHKKAYNKNRRRFRIITAMLLLGIGGIGFYAGQVNSSLLEGLKEKLGPWHKTLQGTIGGGIGTSEHRESPLRGDQPSSVDERHAASSGKDGPAPAAELSTVKARRETPDTHVTSEPTKTNDGERISTTARGGKEEVGTVGRVSEEASWREKPMVVQRGSTIAEIAANVYGAQRDLGLDLIKEHNIHIENLNRIGAGQRLWLPPLSRETLVRQQPDGSYRLILASFRTPQRAEQLAQLARLKSYDIVVTARPVSKNLRLHRVEINGLENSDAVDRAWEMALINHWIAFAENSSGKRY